MQKLRPRLILVVVGTAGSLVAQETPTEPVYPLDAVVSEAGVTYVVDRKLPGVWRSTDDGWEILLQGSKRFRERLNAPWSAAIDGEGRLLVGDSATRDVYRIDEKGEPTPLTAKEGARFGSIGVPIDLAVDSKGTIYVADLETHRIWTIPEAGGEPAEFAVTRAPRGLFVDRDDRLWVVTQGDDQLLRFDATGRPTVVVKGRPFRFPHEVVVDGDGTAYVTDGYAKAVWRVKAGAAMEKLVEGDPLAKPVGLAWDGEHLLVVDPGSGVHRFDTNGKVVHTDAESSR